MRVLGGLKTVLIFTVAIIIFIEPVTPFPPVRRREKEDWWAVSVYNTVSGTTTTIATQETEIDPATALADSLLNITVTLGQFTPDFSSAILKIAPDMETVKSFVSDQLVEPVHYMLHPAKRQMQFGVSAVAPAKTNKFSKVWTPVSSTYRLMDMRVVKPVVGIGVAGVFLGVMTAIGTVAAFSYLPAYIAPIILKAQQNSNVANASQSRDDSLESKWRSGWRSSDSPVTDNELSDGEESFYGEDSTARMWI